MNQKLVQAYLEGLMNGSITKEAVFLISKDKGGLGKGSFLRSVMDVEWETYPGDLLTDVETKKLPEFKAALKLYKTPLMRALA